MNKRGFTLVELLAIILLLTFLIVLVITNVSAPLNSFNGTVDNSKINVLLSAAKDYAEDNINRFAQCIYNKELSSPRLCVINIADLIDGEYINIDDNINIDSDHSIIACYNSDNATIITYYKSNDNLNCNDTVSHRLYIEPQIASVYYQDDVNITSSISTTGDFESLYCEVSPDNLTRSNWATCSISSDTKSLNIRFYALNNFPYISEQNITIRLIGSYKRENGELEKVTKNFRLIIFK